MNEPNRAEMNRVEKQNTTAEERAWAESNESAQVTMSQAKCDPETG